MNPTIRLITAPLGSFGTTGATAGGDPSVVTSGSYTHSRPVAGFTMVACTKACRFGFDCWHPEAAGLSPPGPVSRYGEASPAAVSGCAGTTSSQSMFALAGGVAAGVAGAADVAPSGETLSRVAWWPETAITTPNASPRAIGIARGTTDCATGRLRTRRRRTFLLPVSMWSTSVMSLPGGRG